MLNEKLEIFSNVEDVFDNTAVIVLYDLGDVWEFNALVEDARLMLDERDAYARRKEMQRLNLRIKTIKREDPHSNIHPSIHLSKISNRVETVGQYSFISTRFQSN